MKSKIIGFFICALSLAGIWGCEKEYKKVNALIVTVSATDITAAHVGGDYAFYYQITNPTEYGCSVNCDSDVDWISDINVGAVLDESSLVGDIFFTVAQNGNTYSRTGTLTITYIYAERSFLTRTVTVKQAGRGSADTEFTVDDVVGTYTATARTPIGNKVVLVEWPLHIMPDDEGGLYIDGLLPDTQGMYEYYGDHRISAAAYLNSDSELVVPTSLTDSVIGLIHTYYVGYTPCGEYSWELGVTYYYDNFPDLTFTYNSFDETWESDYGVMCVACYDEDIETIDLCLSLVYPSISLVKVSDEIPVISEDETEDDDSEVNDEDDGSATGGLSISTAKKVMSARGR